jgi:hypothetical protein
MRIGASVAFCSVILAATAAQASREVVHDLRVVQPRGGILRLVVVVPVAEVSVVNGTEDSVEVTGVAKREYDDAGEIRDAQKIVDDASISIDITGSRAIVRQKLGPLAGSWRNRRNISLALTVRIPKGMHLEVQQKGGDVTIDGEFGDIDVQLRVGNVKITTPKKNVKELSAGTKVGEVSTDIGDRVITREGVLPGTTQFFNDGGASTLHVRVRVGNVDIKLTR